MGRKPCNTERGSRVARDKRKRGAVLYALFGRKRVDPSLSLRRLAREAQLGHSQVCVRWKAYAAAGDDAERMAACENHSGGHNRTFTPAQSLLLHEQVLACPTASHTTVHDLAISLHGSVRAAAGVPAARIPELRNRPKPFGASPSFITRWKRQRRVSSRRTKKVHERRVAVHDARDTEAESINYLVACNVAIQEFGAALVMNMDETPAQLVEVPRTALRPTGSKESAKITTHANERLNITTFPTIAASGHKLPICAILRGKTDRCLAKVRDGASAAVQRVQLYYSETGWINTGLMVRYIHDVIQPYTRSRPAALILDDYAAHWTAPVQEAAAAINLRLIAVPNFKGATAMLQPLDVAFNGPLKMKRAQLWAMQRLRDGDGADNEQLTMERVQLAYEGMDSDSVVNAFRKAYIAV